MTDKYGDNSETGVTMGSEDVLAQMQELKKIKIQ